MKHSVWIKWQQEPAVTPSILTSASSQTSKPLPSVQRTDHQQGQTSGLGDKTHICQRSVSRSAQSSPVFPVGGSLSIQRRRSIPHFKMTKLDKATKCYSSHTQLAEDGKTPLLCDESITLSTLLLKWWWFNCPIIKSHQCCWVYAQITLGPSGKSHGWRVEVSETHLGRWFLSKSFCNPSYWRWQKKLDNVSPPSFVQQSQMSFRAYKFHSEAGIH